MNTTFSTTQNTNEGRRTIGDADYSAAGRCFLLRLPSYAKPKLAVRTLGLDFSLLCINNDGGSHRFANATVLADRIGAIVGIGNNRWSVVGRGKSLSDRNVDVW